MARVLIGFAEALPAAEVLFSLRKQGHIISVFARAAGHPLESLGPEKTFVLPGPEEDAIAAVAALRAVMAAPNAPDLILPLDDDGLWLANAALGPDSRIAGAIGPQTQTALDKRRQITAARKAGFAVPPTTVVLKPADLDQVTTFPAISKPALAVREYEGRLSKGRARYLLNERDVYRLKSDLGKDGKELEPLLVQPLIAGVGEGIFGFATKEGVHAWSGHQRVRMMNPHGSGSSACVSRAPTDEARRQAEAFLDEIGWEGPFMIELLRDMEGTAWFMELNGRMWGSLSLARRQGLEYPAWAVARALNPAFVPLVPVTDRKAVVQRDLGRDLLHLLFVLRGPKSDFHRAGWPSFWNSARGVFTPAHPRNFYDYDPAHRGYFLKKAIWTIRRALWP